MDDITWIDDIINNHQKSKYQLLFINIFLLYSA